MMTNFRHLHAFCEVARLGTVSAAARSVHLSQPAVTQAIKSMERKFGAKLFKRSSRSIALTEAGHVCLLRIERVFNQLRNGIAEATQNEPRTDFKRWFLAAQLEALGAVVDHGGFSAAARAKGISQPTIHRAARGLERSIGVPLFEKTSFGVVPTRAAERLVRRAKLAFAEISQARAEIAMLNGGEFGTTVIGAMPLARTHLIPSALIEFSGEFPQHRVGIVEGTYEHLIASLKSGEVDF